MHLKAVLFDYDGVIADTPRLNYKAWSHVFANCKINISEREYYLLEGHGPQNISEILCANHGLSDDHIEPLKQAKEVYMRSLDNHLIYEEIPQILGALKSSGIAIGMVTGASRSRIEYSLPSYLYDLFDIIITSDDVKKTKPHPEPYQTAISQLSLKNSDAIVIENAPLGIKSAKSGGFYCACLTTTLPACDLKEADIIFSNHSEFLGWLLNILKSQSISQKFEEDI
jgi:HAD superfamily hydrolase (TIGR01509 family)